MESKILKFLDNLGADIRLYGGYFVTDTKIVAKVDSTIFHININFKGHRAYPLNREFV
tara:strand:- start:235 stop:408 length:174 start_codon:yes stop_codon:yes gene_type:complete